MAARRGNTGVELHRNRRYDRPVMDRPLTIALANSGRRWIGEVGHVAMLYEQLEALGHRPWIIARQGFPLAQQAQARGWRHLALQFNSAFHPVRDWQDIQQWTAWARRERVDIIHCHRGKDHWLGLAVARRLGRPLIRTRHVVMPIQRHGFNRWLYLRATDAILCVSDATRAGFGPWQPRLPGGGQVVLAAVDSDRFHPDRRSEALRAAWMTGAAPQAAGVPPIWFGLVGRLQRIKGHRYFLEAAALVAKRCPNARFWVAGEGSDGWRERLWAQARAAGIADRFRLEGHVADLPAALAALDVGVIASIGSEGSSRIALEMMASGLPLAATTVGGIPQLVTPARGARLVPPRDSGALAEAMLAWAEDAAARRQAGAANRQWVETHHQPRAWAEAMVATYRTALAQRGLT